ncbi:MAG: hypothetical protein IJS82_02305 [Paludibacteraceae bacterium]|nr:hypothetical protein [Paludibacteraceae bacterium]
MKTRMMILMLLAGVTLSLNARTFYQGEKLYLNADQTFHDGEFDWSTANANLFLYVYGGSSYATWLSFSPTESGSKIYEGTFASQGEYTNAIIVRKSPSGSAGNWDDRWNQTCDLDIPDFPTCNILHRFWKKDDLDASCTGSADWLAYTPSLTTVTTTIASVTEEKISVCPNAAGGPFSLKAKLVTKGSTKEYDYQTVGGHSWLYSTNGTTWTSLDNFVGQTREEHNVDTIVTLPSSIPANGIFYYLYSGIPQGRRLLHILPNASDCELSCEITSFETAISAVNADDSTYTLDGMVAFGQTNGSLVIECDGRSLTIPAPKSPQSFSLHGLPAATENGRKTSATAFFTGNKNACAKTISIDIPNITVAIPVVHIDSLAGQAITLTPKDIEPTNSYVWLVNGDTLHGASQTLTIPAFDHDTSLVYTYKEYYPAEGTMVDLMSSGNYEDVTTNYGNYGQTSTVSDYNFWGIHPKTATTPIHFYDTCSLRVNPTDPLTNGFAVVQNANFFASSYAKVTAREGDYFALIDAASDGNANKKAWYAKTATNPNLKLKKGTTYVLSFWAANINNYGEMDNAAQFVFRIEYNGKQWESGVLDLSQPKFRNNIWHQHSETFLATENCENVTISVVNKNTNTLNIGNDFALDDIQFHAISSVSKVVKSEQVFVVNIHLPVLFTDTICEGESYTEHGFSVITPSYGEYEYLNALSDTLHLSVRKADDIYRKWNDVLFIHNTGDFITYQWFKNGVAIEGETGQRYYDPAGMQGTNDRYSCLLTKADGTTIQTCATRFDDAPRSADHTSNNQPAQIIRQIRVSPHVYIVQLKIGDTIETKKILTTYE